MAVAEFRMPSLGADMEDGTLVEWLVKPGDLVKRGDVVAVVDTQKGAIEIEIYQAGRIEQLLVALDSRVPVGTPLARLQVESETSAAIAPTIPLPKPPAAPVAPIAAKAPAPAVIPAAATAATAPVAMSARPPASPAARRLAEQRGIDLSKVTGTGAAGAITIADVERTSPQAAPVQERKRAPGLDLGAMRAAIAAAMARSKREIPHYYLQHQFDITVCERWLAVRNATLPPDRRLLMGALAIKATALATRRFTAFNGFYRNNSFEPSPDIHIGMAIAVRGGGLTAPALHHADRLSLDELMSRTRDLVQRTRAGRIRSSELSDPTITVTSLGERGVDALYGIIYPPQVAIVGFGKIAVRPWVIDGAIGPRSVMTITLSGDHRVSDGHSGALFLAEISKLLQEPDKL